MEEAVDDFGTGLPVEFLSPEEPLPMILQVEENEEQIIRKAVEEIGASGVIGRIESIEHQLREISSGGSLTAALVDGTGLSIANFLESVKDADLAAALGVEIFDGIGRTFTEAGMAPLSSCVIASTKGKFHVHAVERGLYLVVNQEEKGREFEDETYSGQSETVLRDAILNKVLEDLGALEGIKGNLVVGRDGLLIEAMLKDDQNADLLGAICSQVVIDNERFFQKLDLVPVKQVFIRTGGLYYSLIPLDKEGILMSLLEPEVSREIWNSRLPTSATMLASVFQ
jgi:predicted regulator of Ras-like GTPase activity (Roadblock/LC7/MglB family)